MLRRIGHISVVAVIVTAVAALGYGIYAALPGAGGAGLLPQGEGRTSTAYQLDRDAWTRFPLPRPVPRVRLLVHGDVPPGAVQPDRSAPLRFAVEVQGVDQAGEVVFERLHHFRTGVTRYPAADGGTRPGKAYAGSDAVPTDSQLAVLSLPESPRIDRLRLRAAVLGPEVTTVNARLYIPERLSGAQVAARWPRLSGEQRTRLAEGNVYPAGLLTRTERSHLAAVRWHRIGPAGVPGRDYVERTLYIRDSSEVEPIVPPVTPQGVRVGPHRRATVQLPEAGAAAQIQLTALEEAAGEARVRVFADRPGEVRRVAAPWEAETVRIEGTWQGRLLELQSDVPAVARLFPQGDAEAAAPALDPAVVRVFSAAAEPRWRVRHVDGAPTPLRIDLRCACFAPDGARVAPGPARVALLDDAGAVIRRIDVQAAGPASPYDRLRGEEADRLISEPRRLYFRLPPEVAAVRVSGPPRVHAAVFNRPDGLRRTVRVPGDRFARPDTLRDRRSWFYLPPAEVATTPEATSTVAVQARPPEIDPAIAAGDYDWQAYRPEGAWSARRILTPRPGDEAVRPEALATTYTPLPTGETRRVRIDAAAPRPVRPRLVFAGHDAGRRASVRVTVDGERVLERRLGAASGRLTLPAVTRGRHRIRIDSGAAARFYLSNVAGAARPFGLRLANRLRPGTTRFMYEKTSEGAELLSFRLYPVLPSAGRRAVEVTVGGARPAGLTPHDSLTLPHRRYEVRVDAPGAGYPVLGAADTVGEARRFFLELGADLPPGRYPVEVRLAGEREAYLSLSRTRPGRSDARGVSRRGAGDEAR